MTPEQLQKRREFLEELKQKVLKKDYLQMKYVSMPPVTKTTQFCSIGFLFNKVGCRPEVMVHANSKALSAIHDRFHYVQDQEVRQSLIIMRGYLKELMKYFSYEELSLLQHYNDWNYEPDNLLKLIDQLIEAPDPSLT